MFRVGDLVVVKESPGAPFDIGKRFTVSKVDPDLPLPISVHERTYRFSAFWVEKTTGYPSSSVIHINGHEMLDGRCVACDSRTAQGVCNPPP